jgi:hypothetical protein
MLIPSIAEFDVATGRTTEDKRSIVTIKIKVTVHAT